MSDGGLIAGLVALVVAGLAVWRTWHVRHELRELRRCCDEIRRRLDGREGPT